LTRTTPSEPLKRRPGNCPRSSVCCPRSIGISVRNQLERLCAITGIRTQGSDRAIRPGEFMVETHVI
jgi:hypothetical protein